jgi:DNA-binding MarR family transcriptional regulator
MAIEIPCYCASLRRAARVISQLYEAALKDTPLTITQFTLLTLLERVEVARVNDIAAALAMDQTTLSRTLALMERDGLITPAESEDLRETRWRLTAMGRRRMRSVLPRWKAVQKKVEKLLGKDQAARLRTAARRLTTRLAS